ncbi:uncharacterized protein LOC110769043 [Prunus avium]|uniref:Uncharacterized protein LOC110769043 n=1 Tax=Prunus avium TaxID=42229 RepID=A0A6P5TNP4_PRUAV|nr:uncharacterized protein LOC110769043 [Prunus avium]
MARTTDTFMKKTESYMQWNDTHMQKTDKAIENHVGQIATALNQREAGMMPSQTVIPAGHDHVQAIILRTGKVIGEVDNSTSLIQNHDEIQVEQVTGTNEKDEINMEEDKQAASSSEWIPKDEIGRRARKEKVCHEHTDEDILHAPFPHRFTSSKQNQHAKDILEIFIKVQVNISLLDAIKQIPRYAKFLKDLCTNKRKFRDHETIALTEEVSAVLQRKLSPKLQDPGSFSIPCIIGDKLFEKALIDLGASINLIPYFVCEALKLGDLKPTSVSIQLVDRSVRYPRGILEDVLVKVNDLILPADFLVLEMEEALIPGVDLPLILGRPFMATAGTKIDVRQGTLSMTVQGEMITFKVFDALQLPNDEHECFRIDTLDQIVQTTFNRTHGTNSLEKVLTQNPQVIEIDDNELHEAVQFFNACPAVPRKYTPNFIPLPVNTETLVPSLDRAPELELKPLSSHLNFEISLGKEGRWVLLLQEFDIEIRDKKGWENVVADHLSRLITNFNTEEDTLPLRESFPNGQHFALQVSDPCYADIINFLATGNIPKVLSRGQKDKLLKTAKS